MARPYNVIDADGHVLEPMDMWQNYIDPAFKARAPKLVIDTDGKERLLVETQILGSQKGFGVIGAIGARDTEMDDGEMTYADGRPGGFDPHKRIPDMDLDGIDAAFLYPSVGLFAGAVQDPELAAAMCRAPRLANRSTPTCGMPALAPSWKAMAKSRSSAAFQNGS